MEKINIKGILEQYGYCQSKLKISNKELDIDDVFNEYKNIDVIVWGPPCQGFSQKGKRKIMDDPRNYLFKYFFRKSISLCICSSVPIVIRRYSLIRAGLPKCRT